MNTFKQSTGQLWDGAGKLLSTGYAGGNVGKNPEGKNNPAMQDRPKIGPLPQGFYTLSNPVPQSHLGPYAIPLTPDSTNEMFGRSAFYIHGDTTPSGNASEGCIIAPRAARYTLWASGDHRLQVIA